MNATTLIHIKGFRPVAGADSGECDRCGTLCPKERVVMAAVDEDGNTMMNITENWGRCCAAQYCYQSKSPAAVQRIKFDITSYQQDQEFERKMLMRRIATSGIVTWKEQRSTGSGFTYQEQVSVDYADIKLAANKLYSMTGLPREGSYFMQSEDGNVVRVCGSRIGEREFYASMGFVQITSPA